jgi:hypothetical protein
LLVPIRFQELSPTIGEDDCTVVRAEWRRVQQALSFEVALGSASVRAAVMEIALGHDAKGANGGEHPAFRAVDLVQAVAFSHRSALTNSWKVEILREHISRVAIVHMIAVAASTTAAAASNANVATVAFIN